jgi:two-component system, NtrC family, response regulator GlrR
LQPKENLGRGKEVWQILVVDDEPAVCGAIKMMLEYDGHKVQTANNGKEALSLLEQGKFDLVTTDFFMTGMKGDALAAAIKERLPNQPVLMISANGAIAKSSGDKLPGVDMVLSKPFLLEDLRNAIDYFKGKRPSSSD